MAGTANVAETNRLALSYVREAAATPGTTPSVVTSGSISVTAAAAPTNTLTRSAGDFVADGFVTGQPIHVAGMTNSENNGRFEVTNVTTTVLTVAQRPLVAEGPTASVTIRQNVPEDFEYVSESLKQTTSTEVSNRVRADRQRVGVIRTDVTAGGSIEFEVQAEALDEWLKTTLQGDDYTLPVVDISGATTISADDSDNSFNDSASGFGGYVANQWIFVSGFTESANNGFFKIVSVTTAKMVVSGGTLVTEPAGDTINITQLSYTTQGVNCRSYSVDGEFQSLSNDVKRLVNMVPETLTITVPTNGILTGSITFLGSTETSQTTPIGDGSNIPASTRDSLSSVTDASLLEAQVVVGHTGVVVNVNDNLRPRNEVGNLGPTSIGVGSIDVDGTFTAFYGGPTFLDKYLNFTNSSVALILVGSDNFGYIIDVPRIKYNDGARVGGGINTDVISDMSYQAFRHPDENVTIRVALIQGQT